MAAAQAAGDIDLVSVDSMQVYRGMDIGTAKPTPADRAAVAHHLLDLVEPTHDFTVAEFVAAADRALEAITVAARRAILVGGTGLYHRAVIDDFDLPGEWPDVRAEIEREADTAALHARLMQLDPAGSAKMEPTNRRRVLRALEVTIGSGRAFSSFGPGVDTYPPSPVVQLGLRWDRDVLTARIARRVRQMVDDGFLGEVERLAVVGFSRTSSQALGYREMLAVIDGSMSQDEAIAATITRTRQFAVRQERWFRRDPRVRWIDVEHDAVAEAMPAVLAAFDT